MLKSPEIFSAIIVITVIFVLLSTGFIIFIIRFKMRQGMHLREKKKMADEFAKQLMQSQIEVQEATMSMLGKELHDNICQQMSSTKMMAAYALLRPGKATDKLTEIEEHLGNTIKDIRLLARSLDKEWLEQFNLVDNLEAEIARINASKILAINIVRPDKLPLTPDKQLMLFRIVQEAMQNAVRHSGATEIRIIIRVSPESVDLSVHDNGKGFPQDTANSGLGIRNMKHRTRLLNGSIVWESAPGGVSVKISLPNNEHVDEH